MPGPDISILVVDDEPGICILIAETLAKAGFPSRTTTSSLEAESILTHEKVDVVFVDINMPLLDGIQLMRNVRENGAATAFILVSGAMTDAQRADSFAEGAKTILHKPFRPHEIIYALELVADDLF